MTTLTNVPVFPLNAHIFPGGKMKLRIFESRYLRMVKEGVGRSPAFAMAMVGARDQQGDYQTLPLVTLVEVVDFETLDGGLLGITIEGQTFATVDVLDIEHDGLRVATLELASDETDVTGRIWGSDLPMQDYSVIAESYLSLLQQYPELGELYDGASELGLRWYLLRWLEVLPLAAEAKLKLLQGDMEFAADQIADVIMRSDLFQAS